MRAMFSPAELLDLAEFRFPDLFDGCRYAWDALPRIKDCVGRHLVPGQQGKLVGTPYLADDVQVGPGTVIEHGAVIKGPAIIGANCQVRCGAYIRGNVIVGDDCVLGNASEFKNAVLFNGAQVPHFSYVGDSILGCRAHLGAGVILSNLKSTAGPVTVHHATGVIETGLRKFGAVLGDGCELG